MGRAPTGGLRPPPQSHAPPIPPPHAGAPGALHRGLASPPRSSPIPPPGPLPLPPPLPRPQATGALDTSDACVRATLLEQAAVGALLGGALSAAGFARVYLTSGSLLNSAAIALSVLGIVWWAPGGRAVGKGAAAPRRWLLWHGIVHCVVCCVGADSTPRACDPGRPAAALWPCLSARLPASLPARLPAAQAPAVAGPHPRPPPARAGRRACWAAASRSRSRARGLTPPTPARPSRCDPPCCCCPAWGISRGACGGLERRPTPSPPHPNLANPRPPITSPSTPPPPPQVVMDILGVAITCVTCDVVLTQLAGTLGVKPP
jgi:hypothetical protein